MAFCRAKEGDISYCLGYRSNRGLRAKKGYCSVVQELRAWDKALRRRILGAKAYGTDAVGWFQASKGA